MQPTRRSYSKPFKAQVIQECAQPGASIASVALSHGLNANLVHKWIRLQTQNSTALQPAFVPLHMPLAAATEVLPPVRLFFETFCDDSHRLHLARHRTDGRARRQRAAAIMSLIQSARLNGHDPYAYLKDLLTRLPTQRASEIDQLLPHKGNRFNHARRDGRTHASIQLKYAFIFDHRRPWPIGVQCRVLGVSATGFHGHQVRCAANGPRRGVSDTALLVQIRVAHARSRGKRGSYGCPRIWQGLLADGVRVDKTRVQKLMQLHGIYGKGKRRFRVTTDSAHDFDYFTQPATEPDKAWVGDITYISTDEGWLFLAVVIDLFSRQIVGWSMDERMKSSLVIDALRMAWLKRRPPKDSGLLFHSWEIATH
ncbi:IS3 family transposase, partial [Pseudomonas syringae group genomosp. 3]